MPDDRQNGTKNTEDTARRPERMSSENRGGGGRRALRALLCGVDHRMPHGVDICYIHRDPGLADPASARQNVKAETRRVDSWLRCLTKSDSLERVMSTFAISEMRLAGERGVRDSERAQLRLGPPRELSRVDRND